MSAGERVACVTSTLSENDAVLGAAKMKASGSTTTIAVAKLAVAKQRLSTGATLIGGGEGDDEGCDSSSWVPRLMSYQASGFAAFPFAER